MAANVSTVYLHVVEDVIGKLWEMKMVQFGAISSNFERPSLQKNGVPTPVHDLNVPYEGPAEEYETPTAEMLFPPEFIVKNSGKRKRDDYASHITPGGYIAQQDGSGDVVMELSLQQNGASKGQQSLIRNSEETAISKFLCSKEAIPSTILPQLDGVHDEYDDLFQFHGVANEDYNTPGNHVELRTPTPYVSTPIPNKNGADEDDDDDDEFDDLDQGEGEPITEHLVLALFDKVTRTKNRWKWTLKDGIMHLSNRDILFNKIPTVA